MIDIFSSKKDKPARVLLVSFRNKELVTVAHKLRERGVEIVYWTGGKTKEWRAASNDKKNFPRTIFHDSIDCIQAAPAPGVDPSQFAPVGVDLARSMLACESQVLSMMNSVDYTALSVSRKKQIYYEYLRYWHGVLTNFKIDAVLSHDIPHAIYDYVIWCLAEKMDIKSIMYVAPLLPNRLLFFDDFLKFNELQAEYKKTLQEDVSIDNLSPDLKSYYLDQVSKNKTINFHNFCVEKRLGPLTNALRPVPSMRAIWKNLRRHTFVKTAYAYARMLFSKEEIPNLDRLVLGGFALRRKFYEWNKLNRSFKREYENVTRYPDFSKKFIYVPLHMQPERSTSAQGDIFVSQKLMLDILSAALPEGWAIYVKEHPAQWAIRRTHMGRYAGYYREMAEIRNVTLVPMEVPSAELINKAETVATVTGTSLWEAVLSGKPSLMFGYNWQMHCEGVFRISDVASAVSALEKIKNGYTPDKNKVLAFFVALDRVSVVGHGRTKRNKTREIPEDERLENLFLGYYQRLIK